MDSEESAAPKQPLIGGSNHSPNSGGTTGGAVEAQPPLDYGTYSAHIDPDDDGLDLISLPGSFHEPPDQEPAFMGPGSLGSTAVNLAQSALGAGTLSIPFAFKNTGSIIGIIFLLVVATAAIYSCRLIAILIDKTGCPTYEQIGMKVIHKHFGKVVAATVCLFCWGITVVYVIAMGEILGPLLSADAFPDVFHGTSGKRIATIIFWAVFMLPLSLLKTISLLRWPSLVALFTLLFFVGVIVYQAADQPASDMPIANFDISMVVALPTMFFSYCCQANTFELYHEMYERTPRKMLLSAATAMSFSTSIYIAAGVGGVAAFGSHTKGDILNNFVDPDQYWFQIVAFLGFAFTITFSFPVMLFPPRDAVLQLLGQDAYQCKAWIRLVVAGSIAASSLLVGLFVTNIVVLFSVLGGLCGSLLAFVYPALFCLRSGYWKRADVGNFDFFAVWVLLVGGIIAGLMGTAVGLESQINKKAHHPPASHHPGNGTFAPSQTEQLALVAGAAYSRWFGQ